jgi:hypothetical protein
MSQPIDFNSIVYHPFRFNPDKKRPLNYFQREFLKAQKEGYDEKTFFGACMDVLDELERQMQIKVRTQSPAFKEIRERLNTKPTPIEDINDLFPLNDKDYLPPKYDCENEFDVYDDWIADFALLLEKIDKEYPDTYNFNVEVKASGNGDYICFDFKDFLLIKGALQKAFRRSEKEPQGFLIHDDENRISKSDTKTTEVSSNESNKEEETSDIRKKVATFLSFMLERDKRKNAHILKKEEYNNLVDWVTYYFENDLLIPEIQSPIIKVFTSQQVLIYAFTCLFDRIMDDKETRGIKNRRPDSLFELITSCFKGYRNKNIENLKKATKTPNEDYLKMMKLIS